MAERSSLETKNRNKLILAGLFLSKFDVLGLSVLGFESFQEAFNVIGFSLGSKPASIKNYRDEFDPFFPNERRGWHKRQIRRYCQEVSERYKELDIFEFAAIVRSFFSQNLTLVDEVETTPQQEEVDSSFAQRLITGLAAEQYFKSIYVGLPSFEGYQLEDTTQLGCGYDFRLRPRVGLDFLAVEVKGLKGRTGSFLMTAKEHDVASQLRNRFFLFVVRNFREAPFHNIFQDPLYSELSFRKTERIIVETTWVTTL